MVDVVGKRKWYFVFSAILLIPGMAALAIWGLNLGADFTGGTLLELSFKKEIDKSKLEKVIEEQKISVASIAPSESKTYLIRTKPLSDEQRNVILSQTQKEFGETQQVSLETIGPTIGAELLRKAATALVVAAVAIVLYIALAFRSVPRPASSWRFGISAIIALLHDTAIVIGVF